MTSNTEDNRDFFSLSTSEYKPDGLPDFTTLPDDKYKCVACHRILLPPVKQTSCGHRLGSKCVDEIFADKDRIPCPGNEPDCDTIAKDEVYPDRATTKELLRLPIYCPNRHAGCGAKIAWGTLEKHLQTCAFKSQTCPNPGCNERILFSDLDDHKRKCKYTPVLCDSCGKEVPRVEYLQGHKDECVKRKRSCPLAPLDCKFEGDFDEVTDHSKSSMVPHLSTIATHIQDLQSQKESLNNHIEIIEKSLAALQANVNNHKTPNGTTKHDSHAMQKLVARLHEEFSTLKTTLDTCVLKTEFSKFSDHVTGIRDTANMHETRLERLEQSAGQGASQETLAKVSRMESTVGMHDMRIAESELRFRLLETASYDGKLVWRINNYRRRKQDAMEGRTLSLYSQPFYSGHYGYKFCARVYLHGDGLGKGTHLSLFFVVMKHEYDALLSWPFRQKVTMSLLDQTGGRKHITDSFRPDPTSSSFRRPVGDMNIASGSPMFAPHEKVEDSPYMRDDTIFISMSIDKSDLPEIWP